MKPVNWEKTLFVLGFLLFQSGALLVSNGTLSTFLTLLNGLLLVLIYIFLLRKNVLVYLTNDRFDKRLNQFMQLSQQQYGSEFMGKVLLNEKDVPSKKAKRRMPSLPFISY